MLSLPISNVNNLNLDPSIILNYLVYSQKQFKEPHQLLNLSKLDYISFLDKYEDSVILEVFKLVVGDYLEELERSGSKETCLELPVIRGIMHTWETKIKI